MINPSIGAKLVFIFGFVNLTGLFLILLSCRCIIGMNDRLSSSKIYMKLFKYHGYYWWLFIISVLLHTLLAFIVFGNPFR